MSKKVIEERLNKKVNFFCYPFGDFDDLSKEYIKRSYLAATTLKVGLNEPTVDTYELKRTRVRAGDWLERRLQIYRSGFLSRLYGRIYRNI